MTKDSSSGAAGDSEDPKTSTVLKNKSSNVSSSNGNGNNVASPSSSISSGDDNDNGNARVSLAYASGGGRQPILHNISNLFHTAAQPIGALLENTFGGPSDGSSTTALGGSVDNDDNNGKDRQVPCYCLPCLSCGRGEQGRATVRMVSLLIFPLFLLSFFLLDDLGRNIVRNMRIRNSIGRGVPIKHKGISTTHPVLRRKTINEFPGIRREIIWVPLEFTLDLDGKTSVAAALKCPRGILFLFHGCGRYAASFFYSPQGQRLVSLAYQAGIAIVAFEKTDEMGCWDWEKDGEAVLKIGKKFMQSRLGSSRVLGACGTGPNGEAIFPPVWAFGASSGGAFISELAAKMEEDPDQHRPFLFSALNVQIMAPPPDLDWNIPTIFTVMDGDEGTKALVDLRVSTKFEGGPFKMITTSGQKGIHPNHFSTIFKNEKQMSGKVSMDIFQDLVNMGVIDHTNNDMLKGDPRQLHNAVTSIWEKYDVSARAEAAALAGGNDEKKLPFGVSQQGSRILRKEEIKDANSIWLIEELNVAWDKHEITAEGFEHVLSFFMEYGVPR